MNSISGLGCRASGTYRENTSVPLGIISQPDMSGAYLKMTAHNKEIFLIRSDRSVWLSPDLNLDDVQELPLHCRLLMKAVIDKSLEAPT